MEAFGISKTSMTRNSLLSRTRLSTANTSNKGKTTLANTISNFFIIQQVSTDETDIPLYSFGADCETICAGNLTSPITILSREVLLQEFDGAVTSCVDTPCSDRGRSSKTKKTRSTKMKEGETGCRQKERRSSPNELQKEQEIVVKQASKSSTDSESSSATGVTELIDPCERESTCGCLGIDTSFKIDTLVTIIGIGSIRRKEKKTMSGLYGGNDILAGHEPSPFQDSLSDEVSEEMSAQEETIYTLPSNDSEEAMNDEQSDKPLETDKQPSEPIEIDKQSCKLLQSNKHSGMRSITSRSIKSIRKRTHVSSSVARHLNALYKTNKQINSKVAGIDLEKDLATDRMTKK